MVSSHPIGVAINLPDEVNEIYDAILYHKRPIVMRMLSKYLGRDMQNCGVRDHL